MVPLSRVAIMLSNVIFILKNFHIPRTFSCMTLLGLWSFLVLVHISF